MGNSVRHLDYQSLAPALCLSHCHCLSSGLDDLVEDTQPLSNGEPGIAYSRAEELAFRSRTARMEKLKRRRDAARAYKELETKQREFEPKFGELKVENPTDEREDHQQAGGGDAGPRARQRRLALEFKRITGGTKKQGSQMTNSTSTSGLEATTTSSVRRLSTQSESTMSIGFGEIPEGEEGSASIGDNRSVRNQSISSQRSEGGRGGVGVGSGIKSQPSTIHHSLSTDSQHTAIQSLLEQKTDMLEWDRQEREQEMDLMQAMMKYGQTVKEETKHVVRQAAKETAKNTAVNDTRDEILNTLFKREALKTEKSLIKEMDYMSSWKVKMAARMVDTLCKVFLSLLLHPQPPLTSLRSTAR
jgi:hypothetical protein